MGKSDIRMKRWLSDKERFSSLINGALFGSKKVFSAETLHEEETEQQEIVHRPNGEEAVEKHRDIRMISKDGVRIVLLACENQQEVHYAMVVRIMLYDALDYSKQVRQKQKERGKNYTWETSAEFLSGMEQTDLLYPMLTVVFYYGDNEEGWDGHTDLHGLTGLNQKEYQCLKAYIPNYHINVIDPSKIEDLSCFNQDLQMVFGMLKYRKDKKMLKQYVEENKHFFSRVDDETYDAVTAMLGAGKMLDKLKDAERKGEQDLCKAIDDIYQEGKAEGKAESILELLELLGSVPEQLRELVSTQKDMNILKQWHLLAARANTIVEFEAAMESSVQL